MNYQIYYDRRATKEIEKFPKKAVASIITQIEKLSENPRPSGCIKLKGMVEELWRIRVGDYRVIYSIEDEIRIVEVRRIGNRKEIYD